MLLLPLPLPFNDDMLFELAGLLAPANDESEMVC